MTRKDRLEYLERKAQTSILVLDGAMGTQIQDLKFDEAAFRGVKFAGWNSPLTGNNDLLNLSQPDAIRAIHENYFIVESNTFSSTQIAQADYGLEAYAGEIAEAGAHIARQAADEVAPPSCGRRHRADQQNPVDQPRRQRSGKTRRQF